MEVLWSCVKSCVDLSLSISCVKLLQRSISWLGLPRRRVLTPTFRQNLLATARVLHKKKISLRRCRVNKGQCSDENCEHWRFPKLLCHFCPLTVNFLQFLSNWVSKTSSIVSQDEPPRLAQDHQSVWLTPIRNQVNTSNEFTKSTNLKKS